MNAIFMQLLAHIYRGGKTGYLWLETNPNEEGKTRKETHWFSFSAGTLPVQQTGQYERWHFFFAVNPTNGIPERMGNDSKPKDPHLYRAKLQDIVAVNCLFSDIDDTTASLSTLPVPPSVVVESSYGKYHCYWLLRDTYHITNDDERARIRAIQFAWCTALGIADDGSKDLTRVLRCPGTRNVKLKYRPDYPVVQIVKADFDLLYDLDDLLPHCQHCLPEHRAAKRKHTPTLPTAPDPYAANAWQGLLAEMSGAINGNRNTTLFKTARRAAEFVAAARLPDSTIDDLGALARGKGLPDSEVHATLASARSGAVACYEGLPRVPRAKITTSHISGSKEPKEEPKKPLDILKADLMTCGCNPSLIAFNEVTRQIEYDGVLFDDTERQILRFKMRGLGYGAPKAGPLRSLTAVDEGITLIACSQRYHPIKDYLRSLQWDKEDHIAMLAAHFTCTNNDVLYQDGTRRLLLHALLQRWLIGSVSKVFEGTQNMVFVLCGQQGLGKSFLPRWLLSRLPNYHHEGNIIPDDKDCRIRHATKWIWEISEMGATTRRADVEALKAFLTTSQIVERRAYGRFDECYPAMASFFGTLNNGEYLSDETGSRRFWTCSISAIDRTYSTTIDVDQIWAQAMVLWQTGVSHELSPEERIVVEKQNKTHYQKEHGFEGYITRFFQPDQDSRMEISEIVDHINTKVGRTVVTSRDISNGSLRRSLISAGYEAPEKVESVKGRKARYWRIDAVDDGHSPDSNNSNNGNSTLVT